MDRLSAMEAFVRVIDTGSFSGAARQLGVGQPAVSKTIAQLEERLGVRLVLRSARGLTATEAGQAFYERAKRSIEEADEADLVARGAGSGLSGKLRFGAPVTFARLHIIPHLPLFLAQHPALTVHAILDDRPVDLIEEGIDVALRIGAQADSTMTSRRIGRARRMVLGSSAYFAKAGKPRTPEELGAHAAVHYSQPGGGSTWLFRKGSVSRTVTLQDTFSVTAAEGVREGVFAGLGLCITPEWMFQPDLSEGRVEQVLKDWELPPADLWALFPTGNRPSTKARAFATFIAEQLQKTNFAA